MTQTKQPPENPGRFSLTDIYWHEVKDDRRNLVSAAADKVWLSDGDGTFTVVAPATGGAHAAHADYENMLAIAGEFNGDGLTDLLWFDADDSIRPDGTPESPEKIWLANGDGTFGVSQPDASGAIIDEAYVDFRSVSGDFNGDGLTDILWFQVDASGRAAGEGIEWLWTARGDGTFDIRGEVGGPESDSLAYVGDFNADGLDDIMWVPVGPSLPRFRDNGLGGNRSYGDIEIDYSNGYAFDERNFDSDAFDDSYKFIIAAMGNFDDEGGTDFYTYRADDSLRISDEDTSDRVYFSRQPRRGMLSWIRDPFDAETDIEYGSLADPAVHSPSTGASHPVYDISPATSVVTAVEVDDGIGGVRRTSYAYEGLRAHLYAGSLGFAKRTITDELTDFVTEVTYSQDATANTEGAVTLQTVTAPDGTTVVEETTTTWATTGGTTTDGSPLVYRYSPSSTTIKRDLLDIVLSNLTTASTFNAFGLPTLVTKTETGDGNTYATETANTYGSDNLAAWLPGRVTTAIVTHSVDYADPGTQDPPDIIRTATFTYDASTGLLVSETVEPGNTLSFKKTHTRNDFGVVTSTLNEWDQSDSSIEAATAGQCSISAASDTRSRYPISETNCLGQVSTHTYDLVLGLPLSSKNPNNHETEFGYDAFGRLNVTESPDGVVTRSTWFECDTSCQSTTGLTTAAAFVVTETDGRPTSTAYYDLLGREIRTATESLNGTLVFVDTVHDARGRVLKVSQPYFEGALSANIHWTETTYDELDRKLSVTFPNGLIETFKYEGLTVTQENNIDDGETIASPNLTTLGNWRQEISDAAGRIIQVTDGNVVDSFYTYDALGRQLTMTDDDGNTVISTYDILGNQISLDDPDRGYWTYRYNAFGLLAEQTDANNQVTEITYDVAWGNDGRSAIRGREQLLIDANGGAQSMGGTSANKINAISAKNPLRDFYIGGALERWGQPSPIFR